MSAFVTCALCKEVYEAKRSDAMYCKRCVVLVAKQRSEQYEHRKKTPCPVCARPMTRGAQYCLPCNNKIRAENRVGENNGYWKGGRARDRSGYVLVRISREPGSRAYKREHRLVWEQANGPIPEGYIIHHKNGVKDDNRLENLELVSRKNHHSDKFRHDRIRELEDRVKELEALLSAPKP